MVYYMFKRELEYRIPRLHSPVSSRKFPETFGDFCKQGPGHLPIVAEAGPVSDGNSMFKDCSFVRLVISPIVEVLVLVISPIMFPFALEEGARQDEGCRWHLPLPDCRARARIRGDCCFVAGAVSSPLRRRAGKGR